MVAYRYTLVSATGEVKMSGATHLQNRLDRADIKQMFALHAGGMTASEIAERYTLSGSSVSRILERDWSDVYVRAWGNKSDYIVRAKENRPRSNGEIDRSGLDILLNDRKDIEQMLRENGREIAALLGIQ